MFVVYIGTSLGRPEGGYLYAVVRKQPGREEMAPKWSVAVRLGLLAILLSKSAVAEPDGKVHFLS